MSTCFRVCVWGTRTRLTGVRDLSLGRSANCAYGCYILVQSYSSSCLVLYAFILCFICIYIPHLRCNTNHSKFENYSRKKHEQQLSCLKSYYSTLRMQLPTVVIGFEQNSALWTFDGMFILVLTSVDVQTVALFNSFCLSEFFSTLYSSLHVISVCVAKFFAIKALMITDAMVPNSLQVSFTLILKNGINKALSCSGVI